LTLRSIAVRSPLAYALFNCQSSIYLYPTRPLGERVLGENKLS
jgi:hypothetical protein